LPGIDPIQPNVDIRTVLFTVADQELLVALQPGAFGASLPRDLPAPGEQLDGAARRIIRGATGFAEQYLEQLYTLSVTDHSARWSIIVSYLALICSDTQPRSSDDVTWRRAGSQDDLSDADNMVIDYAILRLRAKLGYTNIAFHLLPERFTLTELQHAYETILDRQLDKRNFRRRVIASGILDQTDEKRREGSHRPAAIYSFRAEDDQATYLTPPWAEPPAGEFIS
jgi:8-oxo-dGTP diphosphatase